MRNTFDCSLYLVTDRTLSLGRSNLEIIERALEGGVTAVQLREKEIESGEFYREALVIRDFLRTRKCPLIINDRVDLALAVDADGAHLGQGDLPLPAARKLLGPRKIIGLSVFNPQEAREAETMGADYLGLSPIFMTATKPELVCQIGLEGIGPIRRATSLPIVGIGSMKSSNAYEAVRRGLDGVAVVSAICSCPDVRGAARRIRDEVDRAKAVNERRGNE